MAEYVTLPALEQAQVYAAEMEQHRQAIHHLSRLRHHALSEARQQGHSVIDIANTLGVSRQQIHRLLRERQTPS